MPQDRLLELLQRRARLEPKLVDEQTPRLAIDLERLDLPAGAVERQHELRLEARSRYGCSRDERLQIADELCPSTEREVGVDTTLERDEAKLRETADLHLRERLTVQISEGRAAPETESLAEDPRRLLRRRVLRVGDEPLEPQEIELVRLRP